jgi:hypothetical protein
MARKIHKKLDDRHYSIIAHHTMRHWVLPKDELVLCRMATTRYLFSRARRGVQGNNVAINHLFTRMFKVNCYIHPNDRLNLTNAPIGFIWMDHKITKAEIKQLRISYGFFHEKCSKAPTLSCHEWVAAGKPI